MARRGESQKGALFIIRTNETGFLPGYGDISEAIIVFVEQAIESRYADYGIVHEEIKFPISRRLYDLCDRAILAIGIRIEKGLLPALASETGHDPEPGARQLTPKRNAGRHQKLWKNSGRIEEVDAFRCVDVAIAKCIRAFYRHQIFRVFLDRDLHVLAEI